MLRFPLGDTPKAEVRELAHEFGLSVAEKADSQDICFVPSGRYSDLIEKLRPDAGEPGDIVHIDGRSLGRHSGILRYTIGQRRGLGLADHLATQGAPLYVVRLDAARRLVVVGPREALATRAVHLRDVNWIGEGSFEMLPQEGVEIAARLRSTRAPAPAVLRRSSSGAVTVDLPSGEDGVSPGQACVFYENASPRARVLGGGFIRATEPALG